MRHTEEMIFCKELIKRISSRVEKGEHTHDDIVFLKQHLIYIPFTETKLFELINVKPC